MPTQPPSDRTHTTGVSRFHRRGTPACPDRSPHEPKTRNEPKKNRPPQAGRQYLTPVFQPGIPPRHQKTKRTQFTPRPPSRRPKNTKRTQFPPAKYAKRTQFPFCHIRGSGNPRAPAPGSRQLRAKNTKRTQFTIPRISSRTGAPQKNTKRTQKESPATGGPPVFNPGLSAGDPPHDPKIRNEPNPNKSPVSTCDTST